MTCRLLMAATGFLGAVVALASGSSVVGNVSNPIFLDTDVSSMHWSVIHSRTVPLSWAYPAGADSVTLTITNAEGQCVLTKAFSKPVETFNWTVFENGSITQDDCFTLTLVYSDTTIETTRLALLRGSFGATEVRAGSLANWRKVRGRRAVVPYCVHFLEGATDVPRLTVSNQATSAQVGVQTGPAGWFGWHGHGGEVFDLTLSASGAESLSSELMFIGSGLAFGIW